MCNMNEHFARESFSVTEYPGDVSLALPFSGVMAEEQVAYVCENLIRVVESLHS